MNRPPTFADRAFGFYTTLEFTAKLPKKVTAMNPYRTPEVRGYTKQFLQTFYDDNRSRIAVFGINPGRFGSGITGINFTDPVALEKYCGIKNDLAKKRELSSEFIYSFAEQWGGPKKLYKDFFFSALSPLGFTKEGKNFNFYDDPLFFRDITPFILKSIAAHLALGISDKTVIILGTGKNKKVFEGLNKKYAFFQNVRYVEHPRFIMQYRRKDLQRYLDKYNQLFLEALAEK